MCIDRPTITRFFILHFCLPFVILGLVGAHIVFLHETGSRNPLGVNSRIDKISFSVYYICKDIVWAGLGFRLLIVARIYFPLLLGDNDNFVRANPAVTPHHIQPEWYFLFAYAILRSADTKLGGVVGLAIAVIIIYLVAVGPSYAVGRAMFNPLNKFLFWCIVSIFILLTWVGIRPVEEPYFTAGLWLRNIYFLYFVLVPLVGISWDKFLKLN